MKGHERDLISPDPKCGYIFNRAESDSAPLWLPVADGVLFEAVFDFVSDRLDEDVTTDPQILNGLSQIIYHYPDLGAPR